MGPNSTPPRVENQPPQQKWDRKRIAGWAAAIVLSIWIPVAIDQAYFRYNAYILPIIGLIAVMLYIGLILTTPRVSKTIQEFHQGFGGIHPWKYILIVAGFGGIGLILLIGGEWYALRKSKEHVAALKKADLPISTIPATTSMPAPVRPVQPPEPDAKSKIVPKGLAPAKKTGDRPTAPKAPSIPPGRVIQAPCSVFQNGGVGNSANTNCGPPEARVTWKQEDYTPDNGRARINVRLSVDHSMDVPAFVARCDRPCETVGAMFIGGSQQNFFLTYQDPNVTGFSFYYPRPFGSGIEVTWTIRAKEGAQPLRVLEVAKQTLDLNWHP